MFYNIQISNIILEKTWLIDSRRKLIAFLLSYGLIKQTNEQTGLMEIKKLWYSLPSSYYSHKNTDEITVGDCILFFYDIHIRVWYGYPMKYLASDRRSFLQTARLLFSATLKRCVDTIADSYFVSSFIRIIRRWQTVSWIFFTFSSYTKYVKRESIVIAWVKKKKILSFWWLFMFCMY